MILNTIRGYRKRCHEEYGELVIAVIIVGCEQVFPYYKASRKKVREDSGFDWNTIFDCLGTIRKNLMSTCVPSN